MSFGRVVARDLREARRPMQSLDRHARAAEAWLCRAQDACAGGGVSYGYALRGGWRAPYAETSGYIAATFFRLARQRDPSYGVRARRILDWLLSVQNADGSFANPRYGPQGIVFDTAQVLFGLVRGFEETGDARLLEAARRAGQWLVGIADTDLRWTRNEHLGTPHVYNTRSAWALLCLNGIDFRADRLAVARANLDWALDCQRSSGFFDHCAFRAGRSPFTHTIAYAARGLLESGVLLGERRYLDAAARCAQATLAHLRPDGHLPSTIDVSGRTDAASCCLTGNCQFAIVWARLDAQHADPAYRDAAARALDHVMRTQDLDTEDANVRGAIKGSQPVWGRYAAMTFPNWAAKFFVDAMWLRKGFEP